MAPSNVVLPQCTSVSSGCRNPAEFPLSSAHWPRRHFISRSVLHSSLHRDARRAACLLPSRSPLLVLSSVAVLLLALPSLFSSPSPSAPVSRWDADLQNLLRTSRLLLGKYHTRRSRSPPAYDPSFAAIGPSTLSSAKTVRLRREKSRCCSSGLVNLESRP